MNKVLTMLAAVAALASVTASFAAAVPGQPAPALSLTDVAGRAVSLADFRGKYVVIEWNNPQCPFVRKHYDGGNMQRLQKALAGPDAAWLTVNSTAGDHVEFMAPGALAGWIRQMGATPTAVLMDTDGRVGRSYGARMTPHMVTIDAHGRVVYNGAIDDIRSANPADTRSARNFTHSDTPTPAARRAPAVRRRRSGD
jgi:hypothetical protein